MPSNRPHTLEDRERTALGLLASSMFAEAQELASESELAACLRTYVAQLLRPRRRRDPGQARDSYEIQAPTDAAVFRRLATSMDALSLSLGPWSGVGRALSGWAARINLAVAEAERRQAKLYGPSNELLAMAAALGVAWDDPLQDLLLATHPELLEAPDAPEPRPKPERVPRTGRVWSRGDGSSDGRPGRRRR